MLDLLLMVVLVNLLLLLLVLMLVLMLALLLLLLLSNIVFNSNGDEWECWYDRGMNVDWFDWTHLLRFDAVE